MEFDVLDPAYADSARERARFRLAVRVAFAVVAMLWLIDSLNWALELDPERSGIRPRQLIGLPGIVFAPLVHADFEHLVANSPPLLVLIAATLFLYPTAAPRVFATVWIGPGVAVWLFGRESVHFGASGWVYGLAGFVFLSGLLRRDRRAIATALAVWFLYGSLVWGVLPQPGGVSWETHLSALLMGLAWAVVLRHTDLPPRKRYAWEDAVPDDDFDPTENVNRQQS